MSRSGPEILDLWRGRRNAQGPLLSRMREIRDAYQGDVVIPLPEVDRSEKPAVANLLNQGLDQISMRIASVMPDVFYPPEEPGASRSEKYARIRRLANVGWWQQNQLRVKMRRRARWLAGYGASPVVILPNPEKEIPEWNLRDPLTTYPAVSHDNDCFQPEDCIFSYARSLAWLVANYPQVIPRLYKGQEAKPDSVFELVEYIDGEEHVLLVVSASKPQYSYMPEAAYNPYVELERVPNKAGIVPVVIPGRIGLDRRMGQFEGMLGMYMLQARLTALEVIAVEKGIFPDTYLVSRPNELASFVTGPYDGRTGLVNIIKGGDIKDVQTTPGSQTGPAIDRLERSQRLTAGIPAEFGGESTTNVRTGRRGDSILSAVVDFPIQEAHDLFSESLQIENKIAAAIDRAYFDKPKSFYVSMKGAKGRVDYTPSIHFTSDTNFVTYSQAGVDLNNLVIGMGQRIGVGTMSKRTAQELDPLIDDPEMEHERVISEALEQALLSGLQQQAQSGALAPTDVAAITTLVLEDKYTLADAVQEAQKRAQTRQASSGPQGTPEGAVPQGAPEGQPGLTAAPGAAQPTVEAPPAGLSNLSMLLKQLHGAGRAPESTVPTEPGGFAPAQG